MHVEVRKGYVNKPSVWCDVDVLCPVRVGDELASMLSCPDPQRMSCAPCEAADFGRRRVPWWIIDARRDYSGVSARWRPVVLGLHRFILAIARAVVNHDGVAGLCIL